MFLLVILFCVFQIWLCCDMRQCFWDGLHVSKVGEILATQ